MIPRSSHLLANRDSALLRAPLRAPLRASLAAPLVALAGLAGACGGGASSPPPTVDAPAAPVDAPPADPGDLQPPAQGFQIKSPEVTIAPGEEITYCYYLKMPNTAEVGVKRWQSHMTPGSHHLILYFTQSPGGPEGSVSSANCGGAGGGAPVWTYSAQNEDASAAMPAGVGMTVPAQQYAFVQMHYLNTTDQPLKAHVTVNGETYAPTETYTKAAAFVTYTAGFTVPPGASTVSKTCDLSGLGNIKFFSMSTHTHKQGVGTKVTDGAAEVFAATDWEHPGVKTWTADPFYTFASGKLTYQCDYMNPTGRTISEGQSASTNEMCMAVGYFFPATTARFCVNGTVF